MTSPLSHFTEQGACHMVDTSEKPETFRQARASARVRMRPETACLIRDRQLAKGDVLAVAQTGGYPRSETNALSHPALSSVTAEFGGGRFCLAQRRPVGYPDPRQLRGANRRGDGSPDRRRYRCSDRLRYVQIR
jgi:hypothetical protein